MRALAISPAVGLPVKREDFPELVQRIGAARKLLDGLHASIKADVEANGPIAVGDSGKVLGMQERNLTKVEDAECGRRILVGYSSDATAERCLKLDMGKADKAVMAAAAKGEKGKAKKEWRKALIDSGAARLEPSRVLAIYNPTDKGEEDGE
jgi:hypothetical protein